MGARTKATRPIFDLVTKGIKEAKSMMDGYDEVAKRTTDVPVTPDLPPNELPVLNEVVDEGGKPQFAPQRKLVEGPSTGQADAVIGDAVPGEPYNPDPLNVGTQLSPDEQKRLLASQGTSEPLDAEGKYIQSQNKYTNMNFRHINSEEDLTGFMNESMRIQEARNQGLPGGRKLADVKAESASVGWDEIVQAASEGRRLTDAQLTAARTVEGNLFEQLDTMGQDMLEKIRKGTVTEIDEIEHAKFGATVTAVHRFIGAEKKKASQALNSLRIDIDNEFLSEIQRKEMLAAHKSQGGSFKSRLEAMQNATDIDQLADIVENDRWISKMARIGANHWFNNLLAMFAPMKAAIGGTVTTVLYPTETLVTAAVGSLRKAMKGSQYTDDVLNDRARYGEAMIEYSGNFSGFRQALAPILKHFKDPTYRLGETPNMRYMRPEDKLHGQLTGRRGTGGMVDKADAVLGKASGVLDVSAQLVDAVTQDGSSRLLIMTDMVVKSVAFRKKMNSLAYRISVNENLSGDALMERIKQIVTDMPDEVFEEAIQTGRRATLTQDLQIPWFENTREFVSNTRGLKFFAPFTKTMLAGSEQAIERIPLIGAVSPRVREMWKAGGEQRDRVIGQWLVAMSTIGMGANMAMDGTASSGAGYTKKEKSARYKANWRPGIVSEDGEYYNFNFYSPESELFMLGVASYEMYERQNDGLLPTDPKWKSQSEIMMNMLPAAAWVFVEMNMSKSVGAGMRELIEAIDDPARHANRKAVSVIEPMFQIWGSKAARRVGDPVRRRVPSSDFVTELWDTIQNNTPGLSDNLPPQVGFFGEARPKYGMSDLYGYMPGVPNYKLFEELFANGKHIQLPYQAVTIGRQGNSVTLNLDKDITPDQYKDSYIEANPLAGKRGYAYYRYSQIRGKWYKDILNELFKSGSDYHDKSIPYGVANNQDGVLTKGDIIEEAMREANKAAMQEYTAELDASLRNLSATGQAVRERIRTGVGGFNVPEGISRQSVKARAQEREQIKLEDEERFKRQQSGGSGGSGSTGVSF
ncbi:MAG: hypothetical protein DRQ39_09330, partial [Gammaproteobacteria bacterium]